MSRAVLLVAAADPYLDAFWLRNFATWRSEVDELKVIVNAQYDVVLQSFIEERVEEVGGSVVEFSPALDHGVAIKRAMPSIESDHVLLMEEDAFVRHPKSVGEMFARIESGQTDVIGGPRSNGTPEVIAYGNDEYGQLVASTGEAGPLLWPCFLWARTADLRRLDHYSAWGGWEAFAFRFQEYQSMDTFGWASLQIRHLGLRVQAEPNYRSDLAKMAGWGDMPWFHVGGLSTGWGVYIMEPKGLHDATFMRGTDLTDWAKRVAIWRILADRNDGPPGLIEQYRASIAKFVEDTGMAEGDIAQWRSTFDRLIGW